MTNARPFFPRAHAGHSKQQKFKWKLFVTILLNMSTDLEITTTKGFLTAVAHVQEPILILEGFIDGFHQTCCRGKGILESTVLMVVKKKKKRTQLDGRWILHVWGKVLFTNTKRAFPGSRRSLTLRMWMNCPTDMSRGTRYLFSIDNQRRTHSRN